MSFNVACDRCNFEATLGDRGVPRYDLGDGQDHYMKTQSAWCLACRSMVDAEKLPTLTELLDLRAQLMDSVGDVDFVTGNVFTQAYVDRRSAPMEHWRANRVSPPRCLDCGAIEIVPHQPLDDGPFLHPECGGEIAGRGALSVECRGPGQIFDPEGLAVGASSEGVLLHHALSGNRREPPS
jgi:hypothetical protein